MHRVHFVFHYSPFNSLSSALSVLIAAQTIQKIVLEKRNDLRWLAVHHFRSVFSEPAASPLRWVICKKNLEWGNCISYKLTVFPAVRSKQIIFLAQVKRHQNNNNNNNNDRVNPTIKIIDSSLGLRPPPPWIIGSLANHSVDHHPTIYLLHHHATPMMSFLTSSSSWSRVGSKLEDENQSSWWEQLMRVRMNTFKIKLPLWSADLHFFERRSNFLSGPNTGWITRAINTL